MKVKHVAFLVTVADRYVNNVADTEQDIDSWILLCNRSYSCSTEKKLKSLSCVGLGVWEFYVDRL